MNVLHKSPDLSQCVQVSVFTVIYCNDGSFMRKEGVK